MLHNIFWLPLLPLFSLFLSRRTALSVCWWSALWIGVSEREKKEMERKWQSKANSRHLFSLHRVTAVSSSTATWLKTYTSLWMCPCVHRSLENHVCMHLETSALKKRKKVGTYEPGHLAWQSRKWQRTNNGTFSVHTHKQAREKCGQQKVLEKNCCGRRQLESEEKNVGSRHSRKRMVVSSDIMQFLHSKSFLYMKWCTFPDTDTQSRPKQLHFFSASYSGLTCVWMNALSPRDLFGMIRRSFFSFSPAEMSSLCQHVWRKVKRNGTGNKTVSLRGSTLYSGVFVNRNNQKKVCNIRGQNKIWWEITHIARFVPTYNIL